jgi:hypothetical protein
MALAAMRRLRCVAQSAGGLADGRSSGRWPRYKIAEANNLPINQYGSGTGYALGAVMAAIGGGVSGGLGHGSILGAGKLASDAMRGIISNAATQGIGLAAGLQSKFSWAGVAASAAGSFWGGAMGRSVDGLSGGFLGRAASNLIVGTADAVASAAARAKRKICRSDSLVTGNLGSVFYKSRAH